MVSLHLLFTDLADATLHALEGDPAQGDRVLRLRQAFVRLEKDPRDPALRSERRRLPGPDGEELWRSLADMRQSGPWWFWWKYGPRFSTLTVVFIEQHPG